MHKRNQSRNMIRSASVVEARAGLIPACDAVEDERRARINLVSQIVRIVKPHVGTAKNVSDRLAVVEILANLEHFCASRGLGFREIKREARLQYLTEREIFDGPY